MQKSTNHNKKSNTKSSKSTTSAKSKKQQNPIPADEASFGEEIVLLVLIALCLIMELSNFGLCGVIGGFISNVMFGLFGFTAYLIPIYIFISAAFLISNQYKPRVVKKVVYAGILLFVIGVFIQMLVGVNVENVLAFYKNSANAKTGGGLIGGMLAYVLMKGLGAVGGYLVLAVLAGIFVILLAEISFVELLRTQYDDDDEQPRKQKNVNKQEKNKLSQKEQIADPDDPFHRKQKSGINMADALRVLPADTDKGIIGQKKDLSRHPVVDEEVHEIQMAFEDNSDDEVMVSEEMPVKRRRKRTKQSAMETAEETAKVTQEISSNQNQTPALDIETKSSMPVASVVREGDTYQFPTPDLLKQSAGSSGGSQEENVRETAMKLQQTLKNFGVNVTITDYSCGPAVTRYEMQPEQGVKVSKIVGLADDIKLNLAAADIRIEAPIPGKAAVGIEVPNKENSIVSFRDLIESNQFAKSSSNISFAVGKDIGGQVVVTDIAKMPHLLIAGATGSGKSVCINTLIMSILYKAHPDDVKMIMIDPKMVELSVYNGIPHLLVPVVTDPKKAAGALNWAVIEMTNRYQTFAEYNVRNLQGYNQKIEEVIKTGEVDAENMPKKMPQIVVIVDELADLMMVAHGEVEDAIVRLSQLARAAGIHLVIATQRPSVDVITGLIKANVPSRIAFAVSSGVDSRTILDMVGAEKLLGKGDMLFYPTGYPKPVRVQGAFVSDEEVSAVTDFIKAQGSGAQYDTDISSQMETASSQQTAGGKSAPANDRDEYFIEAGKFIIEKDKASIGLLQRVYKIGFNRAARIMDQLYEAGVVGPEEGTKPRKVLMSMEEFEQYVDEYV